MKMMKKKMLLVALVLAFACLCIVKGCFPRRHVVVDCEPREVQSIVAEVNSGIGEGTYDKILIFHGKDPFLSSSCVVTTNEWQKISSTGEFRVGKSEMERERIVTGCVVQIPLGCYRLCGIDYYGFANGTNEVFLIVENFGDAGGKFPGKFWGIISANLK